MRFKESDAIAVHLEHFFGVKVSVICTKKVLNMYTNKDLASLKY